MPGGQYKPLSDADVQKIHHAALEALETIGLADGIRALDPGHCER